MKSLCVYCGSSNGTDPVYAEAATEVGTMLANADIELVYGGGSVGLMGAVADAALAAGGRVTGVIPKRMFKSEVAHTGLTRLIEVESMHERKMEMFKRSEAFVALPGGLGTLEELTETATWLQLGFHSKPIVTLDVDGFWEPFHEFIRGLVNLGFMKGSPLINVGRVDEILPAMGDL